MKITAIKRIVSMQQGKHSKNCKCSICRIREFIKIEEKKGEILSIK